MRVGRTRLQIRDAEVPLGTHACVLTPDYLLSENTAVDFTVLSDGPPAG